ncbi:hypothetical protein QQF64_028676 [Cirrhinus molitorella]|uniref:Uncharacterized protein n=1 Tax=Cirrhinus molitorella TaxID=172907 RepID=A0ABR3N7I9_9TELE
MQQAAVWCVCTLHDLPEEEDISRTQNIAHEFQLSKNGDVYASLSSQAPKPPAQDTLQSIKEKPHQLCHPHLSPCLCPIQTNPSTTTCVSSLPAVQLPGRSGGR